MARPLRIEAAGAVFHITSRGDRRENIFLDDQDRAHWLRLFGEVCVRFQWRCYAYCLMDNHYHAVVETMEPTLSAGMRHLNGVYTQWHNRRHAQTGHVFQGRFKAILVQRERHLLELARYVVLNPVRAGMCSVPSDWHWSSHLATLSNEPPPDWLGIDWLLAQFHVDPKRARALYAAHVMAGMGEPSIWQKLRNPVVLGDEAFEQSVQASVPGDSAASREIPSKQRRPQAPALADFCALADRHDAMRKAHATGGYTLKEIAQAFGVHYSTVSRAVKAGRIAGD